MAFEISDHQQGMSLIEIMIGVGIMGIMMAGMTAMQSNQSKEVRALNEQLGKAELDRNLISALADGKVCTFLFSTPAVPPAGSGLVPSTAIFNSTTLPVNNAFTITAIPVTNVANASAAAQVNQKAASSSNSLLVTTIKVDVTSAAGVNKYSANLVIDFNQTKLVRQIPKLSYPMTLQTTGSGATTTVTGCQLANGQGNANYLAKWQTAISLNSSGIYQDPVSGNIGIGTPSPGAKLEVAGDIKIGNTTPAATTCTASQGGSTRYNSTSKIMEYCNEVNWVAMGGGGGGGGAYYFRYTDGACLGPNAKTGGCTCPSGTTAYVVITAVGTYMGALQGMICN